MNALRRIPTPVVDWSVVAVFLVLVLWEIATSDEFADGRWLALLAAAGLIVPFGVWRRWPVGALAVAWTSCAVGCVTVASFFLLDSPFPLVLYSAYIAGTVRTLRGSLLALACTIGGLLAVTLTAGERVAGDFLFPGGFIVAIWAVSRTIRNRTLLAAELHEAAAAASERRELAATRAVTEERRRIAREMHDLVGHSVSVMVVQAGGARRILDRDPDRAVEAAVRIEATGRAALAEMRRLLGILGSGEGDATFAPQPTLDAIGALVERANAAGLRATLHVDGERRPLPAGAELAAYRVVQEALTNALKHAGAAHTDVLLRWHADALELVVADRGPVPGRRYGDTEELPSGGHGIVGMRERVKVYGGELTANPRPDGGFIVRARIPAGEGEPVAA
jgi:signal transduction histidine kinase